MVIQWFEEWVKARSTIFVMDELEAKLLELWLRGWGVVECREYSDMEVIWQGRGFLCLSDYSDSLLLVSDCISVV